MNEEINDVLLGTNNAQGHEATGGTSVAQPVEVDTAFIYEAFTEDSINNVSFDFKPELITLLGLDDYGKSTFVGSFYHLLRKNESIDGYTLIDSDTISGFERRLYLRALNSEGKSDVKRTIRKKGSLLNLILLDSHEAVRHILLSDGAGETYRECLSKDSTVEEQVAVKAADRLLIFVNCDEFNNVTKPWKEDLSTLLRRFNAKKMLPEDAVIYLVLNKYDKTSTIPAEKLESYITEVKTMVSKYLTIDDSNIYKVNSKGIAQDKQDEGLLHLISEILKPTSTNSRSDKKIDWISNIIKENK